MNKQDILLTVIEAAAHAGVSRGSVYVWIRRDGLPVEYQGRRLRVRQSTLDAWLEKQRQATA